MLDRPQMFNSKLFLKAEDKATASLNENPVLPLKLLRFWVARQEQTKCSQIQRYTHLFRQ